MTIKSGDLETALFIQAPAFVWNFLFLILLPSGMPQVFQDPAPCLS